MPRPHAAWLNCAKTARLLGLDRAQLWREARRGVWPGTIVLGRNIFFSRADVLRAVREAQKRWQ